MPSLTPDQFIGFAQFLGVALVGFFWLLGGRYGQKTPPATGMQLEGAAIVSSESILALARAIEAATMESIERRKADEKTRKLGYDALQLADKFKDEIEELRSEVRRLGDAARMK